MPKERAGVGGGGEEGRRRMAADGAQGSGPAGRPWRIAMVGPSRRVRGGISAVVNVIIPAIPPDGPDVRYIATHVDGPKPVKAIAAAVGFVRLLFAIVFWRCDLVHIHTASRASFARKSSAALLAHLFRRKVIVHVHGGGFRDFFDGSIPALRDAIRLTLTRADLVLALSDRWRARLAEIAPDARIRVLVNPVDTVAYGALGERRPPVPDGGGTVLFLGAFTRRKGVYDLVEAVARVAADRPGIALEMGGDQEVRDVEAFAKEKGVGGNVRIMGWIGGQDKLDAFARAHVLALPSYIEGLPMVVLEALAAGLPVVATPVGGVPDVVKQDENGILIEPGDVDALTAAIRRVLGDADLRARMSEANRRLARERHDARAVAATLCGWYDEILSGRAGPGRAGS